MTRTTTCVAFSLALLASTTATARAGTSPTSTGGALRDDRLLAAIDAAPTEATRLSIEIVGPAVAAVSARVRALGGDVEGVVPGALVQASMPAGAIDDLAHAVTSTSIRLPQHAGRPMRTPRTSPRARGPASTAAAVAITNADAWHAAGIRGAVKVGIVDFFDLGMWNAAEHGPTPTVANEHLFCRDTSGSVPPLCPMPVDGINNGDGSEHGVAVAEVIRDVAPDAELYLATVGTTSDLVAAIDWFAANGVGIVNRSLGSAYDGPGDGTGPLDAVVDHAAALGITWFNAAGNEGAGRYGRFTGVTSDGWVDFDNGPGVDTTLTLSGDPCLGFSGIRWATDWGKAPADVTDHTIEIQTPFGVQVFGEGNQAAGEPPLEVADLYSCQVADAVLRIRRPRAGDHSPDVVEVGLFAGQLEAGRSTPASSAANPVVDSRNPALVAVGAIDPPESGTVAAYSSRGPTNDGRVKPDVVAPACVPSTIYSDPFVYGAGACFNGTSAAAPAAAGVAALLASRGLATNGAPLASLVRHLVVDLGAPGPDNDHGAGLVTLPAVPPAGVDARPAQLEVLSTPQRILDTRATSPTPGAPIGPFATHTILDVPIPSTGAPVSAVAVSIVSVDAVVAHYVQALPTLVGRLGAFANLNVAEPGQVKPNFAIVPVGANGAISLYLPTGGNAVVDLMGTFAPTAGTAVSSGRFVPLAPTRALDTRASGAKPPAGTSIRVPTPADVPADAVALVLNVTATEADAAGYLRVEPTGATGLTTANGNYVTGIDSGTMSVAALGVDHTVSVHTSAAAHVVADVTGYITGATSAAATSGLLVPISPTRGYDSRIAPNAIHDGGGTRAIDLAAVVPAGATAVSTNVAADAADGPGFLTAFPADGAAPLVSNLNFPAATPISNAGMLRPSASGGLNVFVNRTTHVIIDVNGYFTGTT